MLLTTPNQQQLVYRRLAMAKSNRMDDATKGIVKVPGVTGGLLAKYQEDTSLDLLQQYVIVPRLKIIQAMTDQALKDKIGNDGTVCITVGEASLVAKKGEPFLFQPRFFYNEWAKWADRNDKDSNRIVERSYDPTSELAKRAADSNRRYEEYPDQGNKPADKRMKWTYVHHFVWVGVVYGSHPLAGTEVVMSMERGEFGNGRQFITAIASRRHMPDGTTEKMKVPLWAQVWELKSALRDKSQGKWWGYDFGAPTTEGVAPMIPDSEFELAHAEFLRLSQLHEQNRLRADHGEGDETEPQPAAATGSEKF
jgi:hypothetical protein